MEKTLMDHFKDGCDLLRSAGIPKESRTLVVTPELLEVLKKEGEDVDLEKNTVNGIPFAFLAPIQ